MATSNGKKKLNGKVPNQTPWETISVPLVKLHLDLSNPRHEPLGTEDKAIAWLYTHEKVEALAKDIADKGAISPLDLVGVVPMDGNPGHFIAVEGNRRLCALLLLNDPDRAPTAASKALMRELSQNASLGTSIDVVRFRNKAEANHWIALRHLGPQEGQGLQPWNTIQKSRAVEDGGPDALAVAILDRARDAKWLGEAKPPAVTTLTRFLKNREVRAALGLAHHRDLVITHEPSEVDASLRQFLVDAMPTGDPNTQPKVHSRTNDAERAAYARDFRERGASPRTLLPQPTVPAPAVPVTQASVRGKRNRPDLYKRPTLIPTGFVCNPNDKNLRALFFEMKRTSIDEHEFATAYLLRAFLERVMSQYTKKLDPGFSWSKDEALVKRCAELVDPTGRSPKFKPIRVAASDKDASHSLHTLGAAVHAALIKDRRALIGAWENWEPSVLLMLAELEKR